MNNNPLKAVFSGFYDLQKMRIQAGNRIVANFKLRLGQETGKSEDELDDEGKDILNRVRLAYKSIAEAAADLPRIGSFQGNEVISDYAELVLADTYERLAAQEERYDKGIKQIVHRHPFWKHWMKGVCGLGELLALVILSKIDIHKARHPSSLWKYCGLDVAEDGAGRSRKKAHLVMREYVNKNGEEDIREGISFNPILKTKLIGVLGPSFLKAKNEKYAPIYYGYKKRLENHPAHKDKPLIHRHNMAIRYMVKMFLIDLYTEWRKFEGLPVSLPYQEAKLGYTHGESGESSNPVGQSVPSHISNPIQHSVPPLQ